jgi:hypothetical protein
MRLKKNKIENLIPQQRHVVAQSLREGKEEHARLLVEEMLLSQRRAQALTQLLLLSESLLHRIDSLTTSK